MIKILALIVPLMFSKTPVGKVESTPSVFQRFQSHHAETAANLPISAEKIDISGHWEGTITRDEGGGKRTVFKMELDLNQKGKVVTGTSYVHAEGEKRTYSANMALSGRFTKYYFKYEETKILNYDPIPDAEWCVKKCELLYKLDKTSAPTLEGIWEGAAASTGNCIPGRIFLQKKAPRV
jgi:ketosteroid isomerase-like protein